MININVNTNDNLITGSVNGQPFSVEYSDKRYAKMTRLQEDEQKCSTMEGAKEIWEAFEDLTQVSPKEQIETKSDYLTYDPNTRTYHLTKDGRVSPIPMPDSLSEKLLYASDKNLPVDPLVKFFIRTLRNPNIQEGSTEDATRFAKEVCDYATQTFVSPTLKKQYLEEGLSEEVANEKATVPQTPFTMEGLLVTKKVVQPLWDLMQYKYELDDDGNSKKVLRDGWKKVVDEETGEVSIEKDGELYNEDYIFEPLVMGKSGDAFYMGSESDAPLGHTIKIGKEMRLDNWSQVNTNPERSCQPGIHVGNQDYISSWQRPGTVTLNCFQDPAWIGCVPYRDVAGVIRGMGVFPYSIKDREEDNRNLYHSSTYAQQANQRWAEYCDEVLDRFQEKVDEAEQQKEDAEKFQSLLS